MGELILMHDENRLADIIIRLNEETIRLEEIGQTQRAKIMRIRAGVVMDRLELVRRQRRERRA